MKTLRSTIIPRYSREKAGLVLSHFLRIKVSHPQFTMAAAASGPGPERTAVGHDRLRRGRRRSAASAAMARELIKEEAVDNIGAILSAASSFVSRGGSRWRSLEVK